MTIKMEKEFNASVPSARFAYGLVRSRFFIQLANSLLEIAILSIVFFLWQRFAGVELITYAQALSGIMVLILCKNLVIRTASIASNDEARLIDFINKGSAVVPLGKLREELAFLTVGEVINDHQKLSFLKKSHLPFYLSVPESELVETFAWFIGFIHDQYFECNGEDIREIRVIEIRNKIIKDDFAYYNHAPISKEDSIIRASFDLIELISGFKKTKQHEDEYEWREFIQ